MVLSFQHVKRSKLEVSDPAGQAFARLLEQARQRPPRSRSRPIRMSRSASMTIIIDG